MAFTIKKQPKPSAPMADAPGVGIPGMPEKGEEMSPEMAAMLLTRRESEPVITQVDIQKATAILQKYKDAKANLENRIVEDELWWQLRHWEAVKREQEKKKGKMPETSSAYLFNAIINKHADAMDNYPEPIVLPREKSDEQSAKILSEILPVVAEENDFEQVYSDTWYECLKHGTGVYGVFWNPEKENGLGDIDIRQIDLLNIFWEPGISDIQKSRNLFIVNLVDTDLLEQQYPQYKGKMGGDAVQVKQYIYDDNVDTTDKSVVVDWYYKVRTPSGKTILHYVKFVGDTLLFASENDPQMRETGFYEHGEYPVVFNALFPEKGTPVGFGLVAVCKDPQLYIDKLESNVLESAMMCTKKRWFKSRDCNINEEQFADWNEAFVDVDGKIDPAKLQEIQVKPLDGAPLNVIGMKIEEMKDTAANKDVNSGGTGSGVTSGAAISALQEAGNKVSRDMIKANYRANRQVYKLEIELMRQFYSFERTFRIMQPNGTTGYDFVSFSGKSIADQQIGVDSEGNALFRRPIFDLKIKAQKANPFSRMEQNERAISMYGAGFFDPANAQQALTCLDMMNFEGIEQMREKISEGETLFRIAQDLMLENAQLKAAIGIPLNGAQIAAGAPQRTGGNPAGRAEDIAGSGLASRLMQSREAQSAYSQKLAERSVADADRSSAGTTVGAT